MASLWTRRSLRAWVFDHRVDAWCRELGRDNLPVRLVNHAFEPLPRCTRTQHTTQSEVCYSCIDRATRHSKRDTCSLGKSLFCGGYGIRATDQDAMTGECQHIEARWTDTNRALVAAQLHVNDDMTAWAHNSAP